MDLKTGVSSVNGCGGACGCEGVGVHVSGCGGACQCGGAWFTVDLKTGE